MAKPESKVVRKMIPAGFFYAFYKNRWSKKVTWNSVEFEMKKMVMVIADVEILGYAEEEMGGKYYG